MNFLQCKRFTKDLKDIKKACHDNEIYKRVCQEIFYALNFKDNLPGCCTFLFSFQNFQLYKLRVSGCGKGKSGGLRIIFSYEREKDIVLLIRVYRKAEKENMPKHEIIEEIIYCSENL